MQRKRSRGRVEHHVNVLGDDVVDRLAQAAIWDLHRFDLGEHFKLYRRQVSDGPDTRSRGRDFAWISLGARDEVRKGGRLQALAHHEHVWTGREERDGNPARRIICHFFIEKAVGRDRARRGQEQRIAIGFCTRDFGRTNVTCCAADILDDYRLTPSAAELVGHQSRERIRASARRVRNDDAHRAVRVTLLRADGI